MSDIRARYVGHPDGADLNKVPVGSEWELRHVFVAYGDLLPAEIDGVPVLAAFVESLLEQPDNWEKVTGEKPVTTTAAKAEKKGE